MTGAPSLGRMLWRGLRRRCPRCGERKIWSGFFTLVDQCPQCQLTFAREEGFWLGAYVINFGVGEGLVGVLLMSFVFYAVGHPGTRVLPWLIVGGFLAVVVPIIFFPSSRTIWTAFDVAMRSKDDAA